MIDISCGTITSTRVLLAVGDDHHDAARGDVGPREGAPDGVQERRATPRLQLLPRNPRHLNRFATMGVNLWFFLVQSGLNARRGHYPGEWLIDEHLLDDVIEDRQVNLAK